MISGRELPATSATSRESMIRARYLCEGRLRQLAGPVDAHRFPVVGRHDLLDAVDAAVDVARVDVDAEPLAEEPLVDEWRRRTHSRRPRRSRALRRRRRCRRSASGHSPLADTRGAATGRSRVTPGSRVASSNSRGRQADELLRSPSLARSARASRCTLRTERAGVWPRRGVRRRRAW